MKTWILYGLKKRPSGTTGLVELYRVKAPGIVQAEAQARAELYHPAKPDSHKFKLWGRWMEDGKIMEQSK